MRKGTWMLGLAALFATACATEAPPRSYVQPNAIKKADLDGTFYYLQTVTNAPPTNGAMFIGQSSSLLKIRFDIQENYLYARRAFPQEDGSEDAYNLDPANYKGQPLAAWRIESQFDIIRDFNSSTGEQTNKIVESTERPWQQREFIRVDWSQNLITDYVGLGMDMFFSDVSPQVQPVSYWESDPSKPDALHIEHLAADDGGLKKGEMNYLDVTDEMIVTPDMLTLDFGPGQTFSIPKCLLSYELDDCASQVVKVRHAFAKVDPKHDVEVRDWDGNQMNMFGVWDVGLRRLAYNRDYGHTNSGITRTAARFNIWEKSCKRGTACEARPRNDGSGKVDFVVDGNVESTWDPAKDSTQAMLPGDDPRDPRLAWKDRTLRTIPYYAEGSMPITYSGDKQFPDGMKDSIFPPSLFPTFQNIIGQWNDAMKAAVKDMTGKDAPHDVFVPCHDPVQSGDAAICKEGLVPDVDANGKEVDDKQGQPILHARAGDPRHSCVFWVNQDQAAGPLGYGPPLYDEITGETISGQAYIYGAALDWYAVRSRDLMLLENGELDSQDFINGTNVIASVKESRLGRSPNRTYDPKELQAVSNAMDFDWAKAFSPKNGYPALDTSSVKNLKQSMADREHAIYGNFFAQETPTTDEKLARLAGTPLEKMMMNTEMMTADGGSPLTDWDSLSDYQKIFLSPVRRRALDQVMERYRIGAEMRGADFAEFGDPGLQSGLAMFTQKYCPNLGAGQSCTLAPHAEEMRQDLRSNIFLSVTLHEVGHNMGCRHNFRGSWDSMDYFPQYWQIREDGMQHPDQGMAPSDGKLHPRYVNIAGGAASQWELNQGVRNYQYSSIMDYGAEFNSDLQGLGLYDKAFIKFSYGHYVEVFTDAKTDATSESKISSLQQFQSALGFPSALGAGNGLTAVAYQTYPDLFTSGYQGIYKRKDVPLWEITNKEIDTNGDTIQADKTNDPLVPYYFCSDEFAEGNLTCKRFDAGADAFEQAQDLISRYQNFYLYNNFKRDRATFYSSAGYVNRIYDRYFEPLRDQLTWYVLLRSDFESYLADNQALGVPGFNDPQGQAAKFFTDENGWGNFTAGVNMGFNLLGQVLTTPSAGWHMKSQDAEGNVLWKAFRDDVTDSPEPGVIETVPLIDGKYVDTTWDQNCGYYVFDECQQRIGYFVDKTVALQVLAESQAYFTGRDTSVDVRQYAIGYVLPFKRQIEEKFGALLSEDYQSLAPYFQSTSSGMQVVNPGWTLDDPTVTKDNAIDPQTGFTLNLYTGIYALAAFPTTFDHDFIDNTKIFVVGNGEASTTDSEIQAHGTTDPRQLVSHCDSNGQNCGTKEWLLYQDSSGELLAAHATASSSIDVLDENSTDSSSDYTTKTVALRRDIGVRMLERMRQLDALVQDAEASGDATQIAFAQDEYQKYRENIQVIRSLENAFGYGPFMTDAPFYY